MNISEKTNKQISNGFILLIAITLIFRRPCTVLIIFFSLYGLFSCRNLLFTKQSIRLSFLIALPLLLELIFFWNNDSLVAGWKYLEKSISMLIFPILIIGNYKHINFNKILIYYSAVTTILVLIFYIMYTNFDKQYLTIYSNDPNYFWAIGYSFANYIGIHGPALNMHLAFVTICNFYFIFYNNHYRNKRLTIIFKTILFIISFYFVVFINSKLALVNVIVGLIIIFLIELRRIYSLKNLMVLSITFLSIISLVTFFYVKKNPYMIVKYKEVTFAHIDKVGKLDEIENPTATVYNSFVTRLSIWKSTVELASKNLLYGVGSSDGKPELFKYYKNTNQKFLEENQFPVHNQYLDSLLRFGIIGLLVTIIYIVNILILWYKSRNTIILFFFVLFFTSNLTDDFLIRFDGIVFSSFWISIFSTFALQEQELKELKQRKI